MSKILASYQDLEAAKEERRLETFLVKLKNDFLGSTERATMIENENYYEGRDPALTKLINKIRSFRLDTGDIYNAKPELEITSEFAFRIVDQLVKS